MANHPNRGNTHLRRILRQAFGDRHYRITRDGEVHVYGQMPNTNATGWYLYGRIDHAETRLSIEQMREELDAS